MATNKYPATCDHCNTTVEAGDGVLRGKDDNNRWIVEHEHCPKSAAKVVENRQQSPTNQKLRPGQPKAKKNEFPPTPEQQDCIDLFATGVPFVAEAGAGTGKTTLLRFLAQNALLRNLKGLYTTFNRPIVDEARGTFPENVTCSTIHSLAYRAIVIGTPYKERLDNAKRVTLYQAAKILRTNDVRIGDVDLTAVQVASFALRTVEEFCKSADTIITHKHVPYIEGIDAPEKNGKRTYTNNRKVAKRIAPIASAAWEDLRQPVGELPFRPYIYLKLWQLSHPVLPFDFILFDECQDANPLMAAVVEEQTCQVVFVGDAQQAINEFMGAVNAIEAQKKAGLPVRQLTQSFRFGPDIAEVANGILGELGADLRVVGFDKVSSTVGPVDEVDAILTRTNAVAVECILSAKEKGVSAHLVGNTEEIIKFVRAAEKLQQGKTTLHPELACFKTWNEVLAYVKEEEGADLKLNVDLIERYSVPVIVEVLENQPSEKDADLVVSTAHKSKGREWDRVRIAADFVKPTKPGSEPQPPSASELRLRYVACTRAKKHLDNSALTAPSHNGEES